MTTPNPADDLQFDTVEPVTPTTGPASTQLRCVGCGRPITSVYYSIGNKVVCADCRDQVLAPPPGNSGLRVLKATVGGFAAGLVGAAVWYAIRRTTHYELGIVAVALGFMVAKAIRKASLNRGGVGYQFLAVAVTYCCVAANYLPDVFSTLNQDRGNLALAAASSIVLALVVPFLSATTNPLGLVIVAFALWQAWKLTAARKVPFTGPHQLPASGFRSQSLPELQGEGELI